MLDEHLHPLEPWSSAVYYMLTHLKKKQVTCYLQTPMLSKSVQKVQK